MTKRTQAGRSRPQKISPKTAPKATAKILPADLAPLRFCACFNARLAARRLTAFYDVRLAAAGINIAQFGLMAQVAAAQDDTLGAIAERAGLDPSTLSRNLQGLVREGIAEIVTTEKDHRKRTVRLTDRGHRVLSDALPVWRAAQKEAEAAIDVGALRTVAKASKALAVA